MAGEPSESVPPDLRDWLDEQAAEAEAGREELLERAVEAARYLDGESDAIGADTGALDDLDARLDAVEEDVEEKIADVRDRVIQVKRETDQKASTDHDHADLRREAESAAAAIDDLSARLEEVDDRVARGFENYEEILEYLTDTTDEIEERVNRIAAAVSDLRSQATRFERHRARREATRSLRAEANRHGTKTANCGNCDETVHLGLLDAPECPHCEAGFDGFQPSPGFFRSATLTQGDLPALEEGEHTDAEDGPDPAAHDQ